ncbi:MAG: AI-2E family transporter [Alphaproteobacteria bacterium]|nr:AI-2E family transporter [Alphaproteobacteria bacterium]
MPARIPATDTLTPKFMTAVIAVIVVCGLYFGRPVLMPLALAVLMSFAIAPLVGLLRHLRLGHVPAVLLSLAMALVILSAVGAFVGSQFAGLASDLPRYQTNIGHKIQSIRGSTDGTIARINQTIEALADQITGVREQQAAPPTGAVPEEKPVPVVIRRQGLAPWAVAQSILGPLLEPLATLALVLVFVAFIMLQKDDLRDRFVRLAGSGDMQRTAVALDEAASRLSHYLALQTIINASFGLTIGVGLWLIGVPNSGLWALIGMLMRFVPYVGVPIAFLFPATLAVAVDPGWSMLFWVMALFGGVEAIVGQMIEPFVYGRSMGLSAVAVVVAAVFWTWLWGPVGLLLSTPLTMCFVVLGRHIESLKFLDVMLGDTPALKIEESLYLRMLAENPEDATEDAEEFLRGSTLAAYYDEVVAKSLMLAQADVNRDALDATRQARIRDAIRSVVLNLSERNEDTGIKRVDLAPSWAGKPVLCIAGRGPLDEAAAFLLVDMLGKYGVGAAVVSSDQASAAQIDSLDMTGVQIVCVSYLEPGTYKNARYQVRRLRKRAPGVPVMTVFWGLGDDHSRYLDSIEATESDVVTTGLKETIHHILVFARRAKLPAQEVAAQ